MRKIFSLVVMLAVLMLAAGAALASPDDPVSSKGGADTPKPGYDYGEVPPEERDQDYLQQRELEALKGEISKSSQGSGEGSEPVDAVIDPAPAPDEGNGRDVPQEDNYVRPSEEGEVGITGVEADDISAERALTTSDEKQPSWWLYGGLGAGLLVILGGVLLLRRRAAA